MSAVTALPGGLVREHCGSRHYQTRYEQGLGLRPGEIWHDRPAAAGDLIQGDASLVHLPDGLALSERGWWVVDHQPPMLGCVVAETQRCYYFSAAVWARAVASACAEVSP